MRFIGRREGVDPDLVRLHGVGGGDDRATTPASRSSSPSTTAAARRSSTPRAASAARPRRSSRARLYAPEMHEPDLLIRTSGEQRISNFLLWQCAYSEFVFTDVLWPDFSRADLEAALQEYDERGRSASAGADGVARGRRAARRNTSSDLAARIAVAIPAIVFAIVIVAQGGLVFAVGVVVLGLIALHELFEMYERVRPVRLAGFLGLIGLVVAAHYGTSARCCWPRSRLPRDVPARAGDAGGRPDTDRADVADRDGRVLDRARRSRTRSCCASCRTAARSSSTSWSARSSATPAPTSAAARSARASSRRASRPTRPSRGSLIGFVAAIFAAWCAGLYQDWLGRRAGPPARPRGRADGAARRPLRVAGQARRRAPRTPGACSASTAARSTASTPRSSRSSPGYYVWLAML